MSIALSIKSNERLAGAHPDLARVFRRAAIISDLDFTILEVLRSEPRQRQLFAQGATKTMKSRHLPHKRDGLSRAVDAAPLLAGKVSWDWPLYHRLAKIIKEAARLENVSIEWGGDWRTFKDGPHWQLPWSKYP